MKKCFRYLCVVMCALGVSASAHASSFADALAATYETNPRIRAEREALRTLDEQASQAAAGFRPNISADYNYGRQRTDFGNAGWAYNNGGNKTLTLEQPIFRGGSTLARLGSADQRVKAGQEQLDAVEQSVMLEAITAYVDVVQAQAIVELSRNNEQVLERQLEAAEQRFAVGDVTRTDVAQSKTRYANARAAATAGEGQLISAQATFERIIGYKPSGDLDVPKTYPVIPASLKEALALAEAQNPRLLSSIYVEKAANYDVRANMGSLLPQLSLRGNMSRSDNAGVNGNSTFDQDSLTLNVSIPLYQSGAEYARIREAKARARQRREQAIEQKTTLDEQVAQAWEGLETSIATIALREDQIDAAQTAIDGVKLEHEYGARTVLDVLDAEQELFAARTNLVRAQRDRIVAVYNLLATLGQLTPENLEAGIASYDPEVHYDDVKWKVIGF